MRLAPLFWCMVSDGQVLVVKLAGYFVQDILHNVYIPSRDTLYSTTGTSAFDDLLLSLSSTLSPLCLVGL
jgi:hypothetical protein